MNKNQTIDKLDRFKSLCEWAKTHKITKLKFEGNEVEFSPLAFQGEIKTQPRMNKEGLRAMDQEKAKQDFEEILTWSSAP